MQVNRRAEYLFVESQFAREVCSHFTPGQIDLLLQYNVQNLENPKPNGDIQLIREVFGTPEILKPGEGNSYLKAFLEQGRPFAATTPLNVPASKPEVKAAKGATMPVHMLAMCLLRGFSPLMRHDGSHVNSGFSNDTTGEIYNQTHDLAVNSMAQYGVFPTIQDQILNRKIIYSFQGLPQSLPGLQRNWVSYVNGALETWRSFFKDNPEYVEKWQLTGLLDSEMRMVKPDGSPIISCQTGQQQIPVVDYTDLAVIHHLRCKLDQLLTDQEVFTAMPHDDIYVHSLHSMDLVVSEYILRDGKPVVLVNGMYDANATLGNDSYGEFYGIPELSDLTSTEPMAKMQREAAGMENLRGNLATKGRWCGYLVDIGQNDRKVWVTEKPPALCAIYPKSVTVHRVSLPQESLAQAYRQNIFFDGASYLVDSSKIQIESPLTARDESQIQCIQANKLAARNAFAL